MLTPGITKALEIMRELSRSGFSAFITGGAVRDILLCQMPADLDIATSATLEQVSAMWPEVRIVGKPGSESAVLPLAEGVVDIVSFAGEELSKELLRRDFTINAMALSQAGDLEDPWGGIRDLSYGIIRATGNPEDRLYEDPLRALRAVRLAAALPRFVIDGKTAACCRLSAKALSGMPKERIGREVLKAFREGPSRFLLELENLELVEAALPFFAELRDIPQDKRIHPEGDVYAHTLACCRIMEDFSFDPALRAAALFHDIGKSECARKTSGGISFRGHEGAGAGRTCKILNQWAWPKDLVKDVTRLVGWHGLPSRKCDREVLRRLLASRGESWVDRLFLLSKADLLAGSGDLSTWHENRRLAVGIALRLSDVTPPLDGRDVMNILGVNEGPLIGKALSALAAEMEQRGPMDAEKAADFLRRWFSKRETP
jgi:tRNA nucleotidyltransferase/poly(A) polymerase